MMKKMRKRMSAALAATVFAATTMAFSMSAFGATQVQAQLAPNFTIVVDGVERNFFHVSGEEAHPVVYNGTTYLPLRAIGELMGKNVNWDQDTLTVTLSGTRTTAPVTGQEDTSAKVQNISAQICEEFTIVVDGVQRTFTDASGNVTYPLLYNGSTYLPLRAIGQLMGKSVSWDGSTKTVTLTENGTLVTDADSFNSTTTTPGTTVSDTAVSGLLTAEEAKSKALAHAGLTSSQVTFVKAQLDWEDGRRVYEVEFYGKDYTEYDYEIDASTGAVVSFDYDAESYQAPASAGSYIGEAKAKSIAVSQVSGATANHVVKVEFDFDDGRAEYEVKLIYGTMEYEFEIDAVSGKVLSKDMESRI